MYVYVDIVGILVIEVHTTVVHERLWREMYGQREHILCYVVPNFGAVMSLLCFYDASACKDRTAFSLCLTLNAA